MSRRPISVARDCVVGDVVEVAAMPAAGASSCLSTGCGIRRDDTRKSKSDRSLLLGSRLVERSSEIGPVTRSVLHA